MRREGKQFSRYKESVTFQIQFVWPTLCTEHIANPLPTAQGYEYFLSLFDCGGIFSQLDFSISRKTVSCCIYIAWNYDWTGMCFDMSSGTHLTQHVLLFTVCLVWSGGLYDLLRLLNAALTTCYASN